VREHRGHRGAPSLTSCASTPNPNAFASSSTLTSPAPSAAWNWVMKSSSDGSTAVGAAASTSTGGASISTLATDASRCFGAADPNPRSSFAAPPPLVDAEITAIPTAINGIATAKITIGLLRGGASAARSTCVGTSFIVPQPLSVEPGLRGSST
jgi:hypothetical protein